MTSSFGILEDQIQTNLLKINQMTASQESAAYVVPLYYNTLKFISQNCAHHHIDPALIDQVLQRYSVFQQSHHVQMQFLDQVHAYMHEECLEMSRAKHVIAKANLQKSAYLSRLEQEPSVLAEQETIFLPQEIFHFDEELQLKSPQSSTISEPSNIESKSKIVRVLAEDDITCVPYIPKTQDNILSLWARIENLYEDHRLDEAHSAAIQFQNSLFLYDPNAKLSPKRHELIGRINEEYEIMTSYYQYFAEPGYEFDKSDKGISMYYKVYEESKEVAVRVEAQLNISIEHFLCIVSEVDLYEQLIPFAYDTKELRTMGRNRKIGLSRVKLPLLSNRQAYFVATAYDRLNTEHNSIFFFSKTITSDLQYQHKLGFKVEQSQDLVELQYKFYILEYCPLNPQRGRVKLATNIDMKLKYLPMFIINKSLRIFAFDYFKNIIKCHKNFQGSPWHEKMKQNKDLYDFFSQRIKQYLADKQ